jgi:hypothetical protein
MINLTPRAFLIAVTVSAGVFHVMGVMYKYNRDTKNDRRERFAPKDIVYIVDNRSDHIPH